LSATRKAQFAPTFPAPTTVTFFRKTGSFYLGDLNLDYISGRLYEMEQAEFGPVANLS